MTRTRASRAPLMQRFIPDPDRPHWNAHEYKIKQMLGLPRKLAPRPQVMQFVGILKDNLGNDVEIWDLPRGHDGKNLARKAHRLHALYSGKFYALGHLHMVKFY